MPRPLEKSMAKESDHARHVGPFEDFIIYYVVLSRDPKYASKAAHVERRESLFLRGVNGPRFTCVQESAEHTCTVYCYFGVNCQHLVCPILFVLAWIELRPPCLFFCWFLHPMRDRWWWWSQGIWTDQHLVWYHKCQKPQTNVIKASLHWASLSSFPSQYEMPQL